MNFKKKNHNLDKEKVKFIYEVAEKFAFYPEVALTLAEVCNYDMAEIERFISTSLKPLPYTGLPNIEKAAEIVIRHIDNKSKIRIIGDYDVDGITSTSLLMITLGNCLGANISYQIPNRHIDGYGINDSIVQKCIDDKVDLIITVDNGISAHRAIQLAVDAGIEVVITDHHVPAPTLPNAHAVVDPLLPNSTYLNKELAGVGVAYKLIQAIFVKIGIRPTADVIYTIYALVMLGTICDVMDIVGENRTLVKLGFYAMNEKGVLPQLKLFASEANVGSVGFQIGPRLNACGRLETADLAVEFILGNKLEQADHINELNKERQRVQKEETEKILAKIANTKDDFIIEVLDSYDMGVTGLIANDVKDAFYRPTIIFAKSHDGGYKASGRSIAEFDLFSHVFKHIDCVESGGGHAVACGLVAASLDQIEKFKQEMQEEVKGYEFPDAEEIHNTEFYDEELKIENVDFNELTRQLMKLAPFGKGNPTPAYLFKDVYVDLETRTPKGYIVTDIWIEDKYNCKHKFTLWGSGEMPSKYSGKADVCLTLKKNKLDIKNIKLHIYIE